MSRRPPRPRCCACSRTRRSEPRGGNRDDPHRCAADRGVTHRDLKAWSDEGKFRPDLVFTGWASSLSTCRHCASVVMTCRSWIRQTAFCGGSAASSGARRVRRGRPRCGFEEASRAYPWPGNIRELQSVLEAGTPAEKQRTTSCCATSSRNPTWNRLPPRRSHYPGSLESKSSSSSACGSAPTSATSTQTLIAISTGSCCRRVLRARRWGVSGFRGRAANRWESARQTLRLKLRDLGPSSQAVAPAVEAEKGAQLGISLRACPAATTRSGSNRAMGKCSHQPGK